MDINSCLDYIHSRRLFGKKAALTGITRLLERLGNPQQKLNFIHVAGTNGKGSVTCMLAAIWRMHGKRVGWFTSPFLERFNERIRVDDGEIGDHDLIRLTALVRREVDALEGEGCYVTEFEVVTAIGILYFAARRCDMVVLETGLGGRLDATNVIERPRLTVITAIGLDHTQYLGDTIEQIAAEKAGILKPGVPAVIYPGLPEAAKQVICERAQELGCRVIEPDLRGIAVGRSDLFGTRFAYGDMTVALPLIGEFQMCNAITAIEAARALDVPDVAIVSGIARAKWPCRFEVMDGRRTVILDGAHNYDGICAFAGAVEQYLAGREKVFVFGMLPEKDYHRSVKVLVSLGARLIVTQPPGERGEGAEEVYEYAKTLDPDAEFIPDSIRAIRRADDIAAPDAAICVFGSLYLTGFARSFVENFFAV